MDSFRPSGFSLIPTVVKNLLIINGLFFLAKVVFSSLGVDLDDILGLHYFGSQKFSSYQLVTYMFMHGDFSHLFFNMFAVWMFGSAMENFWGSKKFLVYYISTGFGAAILHYTIVHFQLTPTIDLMETFIQNRNVESLMAIINDHQFVVYKQRYPEIHASYIQFSQAFEMLRIYPNDSVAMSTSVAFISDYLEHFKSMPVVVGASGSLFGLLLAFGVTFPNQNLYLMFLPIPIKAKYFVMGYGAIELFSGLRNSPGDNVAHFAHLGGMLFGYLLIKYWGSNQKNTYY